MNDVYKLKKKKNTLYYCCQSFTNVTLFSKKKKKMANKQEKIQEEFLNSKGIQEGLLNVIYKSGNIPKPRQLL